MILHEKRLYIYIYCIYIYIQTWHSFFVEFWIQKWSSLTISTWARPCQFIILMWSQQKMPSRRRSEDSDDLVGVLKDQSYSWKKNALPFLDWKRQPFSNIDLHPPWKSFPWKNQRPVPLAGTKDLGPGTLWFERPKRKGVKKKTTNNKPNIQISAWMHVLFLSLMFSVVRRPTLRFFRSKPPRRSAGRTWSQRPGSCRAAAGHPSRPRGRERTDALIGFGAAPAAAAEWQQNHLTFFTCWDPKGVKTFVLIRF